MVQELSTINSTLALRADAAKLLERTAAQLRKDLGVATLRAPVPGRHALEDLRGQVLEILERGPLAQAAARARAINRIDLTEGAVREAIRLGGQGELAGQMVLRCVQKVLSRERFSGRL
jgi:hypothetical protein